MCLSLNQIDASLLIGLLGIQQGEIGDLPEIELSARDIQRGLSGALGSNGGSQGIGVGLDGMQRVSDILKGRNDCAAILRRRLIEGGPRGSAPLGSGSQLSLIVCPNLTEAFNPFISGNGIYATSLTIRP